MFGVFIADGDDVGNACVLKNSPTERVGIVCRKAGKYEVVEYSELSDVIANMRDAQGNRLTCLKVTGGQLRVRTPLTYLPRGADTPMQEKVNAIRLYAGEKFETAETVPAGGVCAVQGLTQTYPGQGLGSAAASMPPSLEPVLTYRIGLPPDVDARAFLPRLRELEEEGPQLHIVWDEALREIPDFPAFVGEPARREA